MAAMSSTASFPWVRILLLTTMTRLLTAAPFSSSKDRLRSPSTYNGYQTFLGAHDNPIRARRAPWAPSLTRSDMYLRKVMELTSQGKGKREAERDHVIELGDISGEDLIHLLRYLEMKVESGRGPSVFEVALKASKTGDSERFQAGDDVDDDAILPPLEEVEDFVEKRSGTPLHLGFGQSAANAAMNAFENILDEGKNYEQARHQNPVRFLG